jgi:hypothetical protein
MPAPMYIPRRQNPWTNMMPGLLQNLVLQKIGQNMRLKEKEMEINRERRQLYASSGVDNKGPINNKGWSVGQLVARRKKAND